MLEIDYSRSNGRFFSYTKQNRNFNQYNIPYTNKNTYLNDCWILSNNRRQLQIAIFLGRGARSRGGRDAAGGPLWTDFHNKTISLNGLAQTRHRDVPRQFVLYIPFYYSLTSIKRFKILFFLKLLVIVFFSAFLCRNVLAYTYYPLQ